MGLFKKIQFKLNKEQKQKITDYLKGLLDDEQSYKTWNKGALKQLATEPANHDITTILKACMANVVLYLLNHANKAIDPHIPTHERKVKAAFDALHYLSMTIRSSKADSVKKSELDDILRTLYEINRKIEVRKDDKTIKLDDLDFNQVRTCRSSSSSQVNILEGVKLSENPGKFGAAINNSIRLALQAAAGQPSASQPRSASQPS